MAPRKKPKKDLCASAKYYRENPDARKKKANTDKKVNSRSDQKAKRRELGRKNYKTDKSGKSRAGKDYDHAVGRYVKSSVNRGRKGEGNRKKKK